MFSRREFMGGTAAALGLAACGDTGSAVKLGQRKISKVGIQTYTLREIFEPDPKGTLEMIKAAGYDYVELNERNFVSRGAQELKDMLDEVGLPSPATHMNYDASFQSKDEVIKVGNTLGLKYIVVPYMPDDRRSLEDWKEHAKNFNESGKAFADAGMRFAYHNHQFEFDDLGGGTTAMDILLAETDPAYVDFELDIYWTELGKANIKDLFERAPGRFKLCHLKDMIGDPWTAEKNGAGYETITKDFMVNVGEGDIDFESIFAMNDLSGMEYFIAEHDQPRKPFKDAIGTSYNAIKAMRF